MYTKHGHHIPGTVKDEPQPIDRVNCGGIFGGCASCEYEGNRFLASGMGYGSEETDTKLNRYDTSDPTIRAKNAVYNYVETKIRNGPFGTVDLPPYDVYIVTFAYILGGWKAMVSTTLPDGRYYEVTYNFAKKETYLDVYKREENICIQD